MENPLGQKREQSPYNKFMQQELQRQKEIHPEKDHRQCFKAAAAEWQAIKNEEFIRNQEKKIHRAEGKKLLKTMKVNDMYDFDVSDPVICDQFGIEVLPDLTNLSKKELERLCLENVIKTFILHEQSELLLEHERTMN